MLKTGLIGIIETTVFSKCANVEVASRLPQNYSYRGFLQLQIEKPALIATSNDHRICSSQNEETIEEPDEEDPEEEVSDEGVAVPRKRGRKPKHAPGGAAPRGKPGRKPKVPTLKIKFNKRKRTSSVSISVSDK